MSFAEEALQAVRKTLTEVLAGRPAPIFDFVDPRFKEHCGLFVTLKKHGELRGCIGLVRGIEPLSQAIGEMAVAAATHDPRFSPVRLRVARHRYRNLGIDADEQSHRCF